MVRPETPPRRRWRWPLGIGLAAATLIGLVGVGGLDVLSGSDGSDSGVLPRPPDLVALDDPTIVWPLGEVGECLVQVAESTSLQPVDCDRPHDLERFHRGELGDVDGEVTTDRLDAEVERECLSAAPPTDPNSPIRIAASGPGLDSWRSGDRTFQCFFGVSDGRTSGPVAAKPLEPN
ncbi:MAG: Septum formation [Actinomycetota bacterium]